MNYYYYGIRDTGNNYFFHVFKKKTRFVSINGYLPDLRSSLYFLWCTIKFNLETFIIFYLLKWSPLCNETHFSDNISPSIISTIPMKLKKTWLIMTWRTWTIPAILLKLNLLKNGNKVLFTLLKNLPKDSVKHLGIKFNYNFTWHHQINNVNTKLNRALYLTSSDYQCKH